MCLSLQCKRKILCKTKKIVYGWKCRSLGWLMSGKAMTCEKDYYYVTMC